MSLTKMDPVFPGQNKEISNKKLAEIISRALHADFGKHPHTIKRIGQKTGVNLHTIKNWYEGSKAPSSGHLLLLSRHSPTVLKFVLEQIGGKGLWEVFQLFWDVSGADNSGTKNPIYRDKNVPINVPIKLNKRQKYFLILLKSGKKGTAEDIANKWQVTTKTAKRDILKLKDAGRIRFRGARKTGHYEIIDHS